MESVVDRIRRLGKESATSNLPDDREQAIIDRHTSEVQFPAISVLQKVAQGKAEIELDARRQQRAYAESAPREIYEPTKAMLSSLGDRNAVLETLRQMSPEQREEALKLAPGISQQLGDDRGGIVGRTLGAVSRGITHSVSQPVAELAGQLTGTDWGGTDEEIAYIRQLDAAAAQEFSPARPGDPWYQSGPLQAAQMAPWMATVVGGAGLGRAAATAAAKPLAAQMATRAGMGRATLGVAGKAGEMAGITTAAFPSQYAQEVDQLKQLGMQDGTQLRLLAAGTAAIAGLVEGAVPNPFKTGPVPLTEGAVKAARQYLWNAAKNAPGEMSEEYLQGVTSGLGKTVAGYLDENAEDKSISDAFKNGWEQAKEAALPMAFLLGVPAIGGAGLSAARAQRLQQAMAKGFVSSEDAKELGIEGKNRKERMENANKQLEEELAKPPTEPPAATGQPQVPPSVPPSFPNAPGATQPPSLPPGTPPAIPGQPQPRLPGPSGTTPPAPTGRPPRLPGTAQPTQGKPPLPVPSTPTPPQATPKVLPTSGQTPGSIPEGAAPTETPPKPAIPQAPSVTEEVQKALDVVERIESKENPSKRDVDEVFKAREFLFKNGYSTETIGQALADRATQKPASGSSDAKSQGKRSQPVADPVSELDQAEDELAGLFGEEETPATPKPTEKPPKAATSPTTQPGWEIVEGDGGKLFRENQDPNLKPSQRLSTRVAVDPSENVLATKDRFGKPIPPEILAARQEFVDKAKPGAEFEIKGFPGQTNTVQDDGSLLNTSDQGTKRVMGNVQSRANQVKPGDITWKETPRATPTPAAPAVDAETKGAAATPKEATPKEATVDDDFPTDSEILTNPKAFDRAAARFNKDIESVGTARGSEGQTVKIIPHPTNKDAYGLEVTDEDGNKENVFSKRKDDWTLDEAKKQAGTQGGFHPAYRPREKQSERVDQEETPTQPPAKQPESVPEQPPVKPPAKLGTKGVIKPARKMEPTEEGRPADGKPVMPGDRFVTNTGRETTPFPKYSGSSNRQVINADKKAQLWLIENAIAEAESRGDDFNLTMFRGELETARKGKLPQASKDSATLYVFGDYVPKVPKPFTKPLVEKTSEMSPIGDKSENVPAQPNKSNGMFDINTIAQAGAEEDIRQRMAAKDEKAAKIEADSKAIDEKARLKAKADQELKEAEQKAREEEIKKRQQQIDNLTRNDDRPGNWDQDRVDEMRLLKEQDPAEFRKHLSLAAQEAYVIDNYDLTKNTFVGGGSNWSASRKNSVVKDYTLSVGDTKPKAIDRIASDADQSIVASYSKRPLAIDELEKLPQGIPAYVISGMQRSPGRIDEQKYSGRPIGVAVGPKRMSDNVVRKIAAHVDRGGTLFVDSGMFGTVKKGEIGEEPNWGNVFDEYARILASVKPANRRNVMLVAPDFLVKIETADGKQLVIGDTMRTLDLQERYATQINELMDQGAKVIIPLQRDMSEDPMDLRETASLATNPLDLTSGNFAWGIPYNESAWPDQDILDLIRNESQGGGSGMHLHLLGGGKARAEKLWDEIRRIDPTVKLTGDAATEVRNAYRADRKAAESAPESGSLSIDEFADIFANPEQEPAPAAEKKPRKPRSIRKDAPPRKPKAASEKKPTSEGVQEGLDEAKAGADLILKGLKDIAKGINPFSGPPINRDIAVGMGMMANGLIKAGKYKFLEFVDAAVEMLGAPAVRYLGPYLEAGWNKKAETDNRLDKATSIAAYLAEPEALYTVEGDEGMIARVFKHKDGFSVNVTDTNSGESGDRVSIFPTLNQAMAYADTIKPPQASASYGTLEEPNRVKLGKHFQQQLESGKDYKSIVEARKEAATLIAGEEANIEPGTPAAKAIDEAVEQGVVRAAREIAESSSDPMEVYDRLLDLYERQPRLAVRTGTSMQQQAYSTPAPAAWIATILSDTKRDNTAYDSSAGNGMLLLGVDIENAMANELNPDRAEALRELGYDVHEGDATEYTPDTPPERIIINPPFGELEGKTWTIGGITTDKIDHAIVLKTLKSLPDDGKAVLIIGSKGFEQRQPKDELRRGEAYKNDKNFYNALYDGFNVTDHFTLHGDLYAKQGAAFPIDVIVIDGRGQSELPKPYQIDRQNAIPRVINSWKELRDVGERYLDTGTGRPSDLSTEPVEDDMAGLSSLLEGQGERTGGKGGRTGKTPGGRGGVPSGRADNAQQPRGDSGSSSVSGAPDEPGSDRAERLPDDNQPGAPTRSDGGTDAKKLDREADVGSEDGLQLPYSQRSSARNVGTLVPATHARSVQEALEKAELRYGNLDEFVASELGYKPKELMNYFSAEQIDALALNIARHKEGKAFVLGDQTGVGKGRVAAASMVYAKRQGLVPVFMTQSPDLFADMYRDLQDIGQHSEGEPFYALATNTLTGKDKIELPDGTMITQTADFAKDTFNEVARNVVNDLGPIAIIAVQKTTDADGNPLGTTPTGRPRVRSVQEQREYDAVFSTYSQMQTVGGETKDRHAAMSLIASKAFFVLDESHNAGGVKARSGGRGNESESADAAGRAARLRELVSESQGVLFLSATYAKNPDVMDLYAKTGMADAIEGGDEALIETINKGGIPLQQVLSEMLVESGAYMRREKSFDGIEFGAVVKETGRQEAGEIAGIFDAINSLDKIKNDIVSTETFRRWLTAQGLGLGKDSATGRRGMESSTFSSIVHNLVDQMLLSVKADVVADEAIASLERGESPVIALSNTAGAALDNYLSEFPAEVGDEIAFGFNSTAYRYLERSREIMLTDVDSSGKRTGRRVRLPDEVLGEDGIQAYNAAKALIDNFAADIPASPIDHIRNRLEKAGYKVAEITGRDMMVDYSGNKMRLARRPASEQGKSGKLTSVRGYNSGEIHALILNQSGSTGLSAHASSKFINQKRRHMIVAQADRNIDTFMQMLGRINRTGQVEQHQGQPKGSNLPRYTLLMTDVPAEIRPASVLIKKLSSLNANVTADAKGSVSFDAPDILNKVGDRVVAEYVADNPALNHALDDIVEVNAEGSPRVVPDIARKVSGRMAMRPIPEQQAFWDAVTETYAEEIEQLNKLGKNPLAATKLDLGARTLERVEIFAGDATADSPFLQPAYADRALVKKQGEPMTPEEIKSAVNKFYGLRAKRKRGADPFGDMAAEMHREAITGENAPQNVTVSQPDLRQAIMAWSSEQIARAEEAIGEKVEQQISRLVNQEAIDRVRSRAATIETTIRRRLNSIAPGMAVTVSEALEEGRYSDPIAGVVIDVKAKKGNEHLPSGWVATIAISSPDRVVRVPFSRIETAGQAGDMYVAPMFEVAGDSTYIEWEEIGDVYEDRIIGTGNVLAAFDKLVRDGDRGNIIFFTNEEGVSQRGVLMPRSFNFDRWAESRPATFKTAEQVFEFINIEQGRLNHQANDPNFAIQFVMDGSVMLVRSPRSRQRSGRYTTNQELIAASGTDFVSVGQILQMKVRGKQQQLAVLDAALKLGPLVAANFKEDAKAVISRLPANASTKTKLQQAAEKANQGLSDAIDEFGNVIKGKLGSNLPLNPEVIAAAAKVVAKAIEAGVRNFAELMERMVKKYGEKMAKRMEAALQQEWDKQVNARSYSEDGTPPTLPQPHPELVQPEPIPLTSVKNAIVDELRISRGETPMPDVIPQTVQQWLEVAGNRIANEPYAGNTLVEQLLTGGKTSVDELDGMVLQYHYRAVNNLFGEADLKLRQAKSNGDPEAIAIAQDEARVIMRRLTAIETALDKAGTAWGRAGVSRQVFLKQDFSLGSMVKRARVAKGGNELSDEQLAKISEQAKQIEELQKQIAELETKAAEQSQVKAIDDAIEADIEDIRKPVAKPKSRMRIKAEEKVATALEVFRMAAKGKLYANPIDPEVLIPAIDVVKAYFDLGVVTFREFMSAIAKSIGAKEAKAAKPTFRAAWDQLQTAGALVQPSLDLANPRKLTQFARSVQRTLIENGIRDREEVVDGVHEALQEVIPEITRRQTMDALSSYGQFSQLSKDPIDQIVRDINGQLQQLAKLEDMEQGIAPAKTGVERRSMSDEERRLTQLVNEAKRRGGFVVTDPETQLKSAMAAAKTAVRNRIADMNFEIQTGSRIVRGKTELIPDAELEQLRKERDELQKVHKEMFPPKGATQAQKIASASRALDAAIASLQAKLAVGDISPAPQPKPLSTPELDAKRARLKELNAQRDALRKIANPGMTAEQIKIRALDKSIAELEKQLATGNFAPKPKPAPLTSPEINARQAKLEELRATKKAILAAANPKMTPEQRASRAYEAHLRKQLAIYMEKIAQGDFAPAPKKQPRALTQGELNLKKQLADVKNDFFEALAKYHLENLSPGERAIDAIRETAHLSRAIMTSIDLSAVLRQGGLGVYSHPVMARKAAAEMWNAIWSREAEFQSIEKLRMRQNSQLYEDSGLNLTDSEGKLTRQEEAFMGRWARTGIDFAGEKVQAASKIALEPVAASARAYVTFINNLRADLFDVMVENLGPGGQVTPEEAKVIASYINVATGRSDLRSLNEKAATLNTVFFAPRYVASRFQYLALPFYLLSSKESVRVKKLIGKEYARTFTGAAVFIGSLAALAYLAAGGDDEEKPSVEVNPLSSDFSKVRIGETRIDPLAGLAQVIVFSSRMAAMHTKNSVTGKVKPFYDGDRYETTHLSEAWRFTRTKLAPVPGAVVTAMSGMENVVGDPVTPAGLAAGLFIPISTGEFLSTMEHRGIPKGLALNLLNLLGASVNTYGPKTAYLDATPEDRAKMLKDYMKHMQWDSDLPAFSPYLSPEELKQVQARQDERRGDLVFEAMGKLLPKNDYKTEVHYEEAKERHDKANKNFEEFRKQYAPTATDAIRYLTHHFDREGGIKIQGKREAKPSYVERRNRVLKHYQSLPK